MWGQRPIEGVFYFVTLTNLLFQCLEDEVMLNAALQAAWVLTIIYGSQKEGIRVQQFIDSLIFALNLFVYMIDTSFYSESHKFFGYVSLLTWLLSVAIWLFTVYFVAEAGAMDF